MKIKKFEIRIGSFKQTLREASKAMKKAAKGEKIKHKNIIGFEDIATFRKFFTEKRIELLKIIKLKKPPSIKQLSKLVNRDFKSVNKDVHLLKDLGVLSLKQEKEKKTGSIKPMFDYDELDIKCRMT